MATVCFQNQISFLHYRIKYILNKYSTVKTVLFFYLFSQMVLHIAAALLVK